MKKFKEWEEVKKTFILPDSIASVNQCKVYMWRGSSPRPVYLDDVSIAFENVKLFGGAATAVGLAAMADGTSRPDAGQWVGGIWRGHLLGGGVQQPGPRLPGWFAHRIDDQLRPRLSCC